MKYRITIIFSSCCCCEPRVFMGEESRGRNKTFYMITYAHFLACEILCLKGKARKLFIIKFTLNPSLLRGNLIYDSRGLFSAACWHAGGILANFSTHGMTAINNEKIETFSAWAIGMACRCCSLVLHHWLIRCPKGLLISYFKHKTVLTEWWKSCIVFR